MATSCGPGIPHEIVSQEEGFMIINLESKVEPKKLSELANYYFEENKTKQSTFKVDFCIPSVYPDYPETPWAMINIDRSDNTSEDITSVRIFGTMNENEKNNLQRINPKIDGIRGKWYFNEPILEATYILIEQPNDTSMLIFRAAGYEDYNGETYPDFSDNSDKDEPDLIERLKPANKKNEYCIDGFTTPFYRINEKGELILLNRIKSYKDSSHPVLEPIPFNP